MFNTHLLNEIKMEEQEASADSSKKDEKKASSLKDSYPGLKIIKRTFVMFLI